MLEQTIERFLKLGDIVRSEWKWYDQKDIVQLYLLSSRGYRRTGRQ